MAVARAGGGYRRTDQRSFRGARALALFAVPCVTWLACAGAARAQLCEVPLIVTSSVKPNVLLAFDTSASMRNIASIAGKATYDARATSYKGDFESYLATLDVAVSPLKKHMRDLTGSTGVGFTDAAIYDAAENKVCNSYNSGDCLLGLSWTQKCNLGVPVGSADWNLNCVDNPLTKPASNNATNEGKVPLYEVGVSNPDGCYAYGKGMAVATWGDGNAGRANGRSLNGSNPCLLNPTPGWTSVSALFQGKFLNYLHLQRTRDDVARSAMRNLVEATKNQINWGLMNFVPRTSSSIPGPEGLGGLLTAGIDGTDSVASAAAVESALREYAGEVDWNASFSNSPPDWSQSGMMMNSFGSTELADLLRDAVRYFQGDLPRPAGGTYASPISYGCQPNFTVLTTDGRPTGDDMAENALPSYCTGDYSDATREGSQDDDDAVDDLAACLHQEADLSSSLPGRQSMDLFTIGFADDVASATDILADTATEGGGEFYAAQDEAELIAALSNATKAILERSASATSAAVVSTSGVGTDILVTASFQTVSWDGQLKGYGLPYASAAAPLWKAGDLLETRSASSRRIYTAVDGGDADSRIDDRLELSLTNESTLRGYLGAADSSEGAALINWIRGVDQPGFRTRDNDQDGQVWKLGDIVNSNPVVVGAPPFFYPDSSYQSFYSAHEARSAVIYVAANDGMLHAFDAVTGAERWAFVPNFNLPVFKEQLVDPSYCHRFTFDGSPRVVDAYFGIDGGAPAWHTVLVVGGGAHGGYVALDVTDPGPASNPTPPAVLWQWPNPTSAAAPAVLAEARLGAATARPAVQFLAGGTFPTTTTSWYATIPSGAGTSDGDGYIFNVALATGVANAALTIDVDPANESGNRLTTAATIDLDGDRATDRVYVGDRLGRLWRWDVAQASNPTQLVYDAGTSRPIVARPVLAFRSKVASDPGVIAYFGTGKFDEEGDKTDTTVQRLFGLVDEGTRTGTPGTALLATSDLTNATDLATASTATAITGDGWFVNLKLDADGEPGSGNDAAGARVIYPGVLTNGIFFATVFQPTDQVCDFGGLASLLAVNASSGGASGSPVLDIAGDGTVDESDRRDGNPARAVALGNGVPSKPVMDPERHTLIVQTSDTVLHPVKIATGGSPVESTRWKILNR